MPAAPTFKLEHKKKQKSKGKKSGPGLAPSPPWAADTQIVYTAPKQAPGADALPLNRGPMTTTFSEVQKKKAKKKKGLGKQLDQFAGDLGELLGKYGKVKEVLAGEAAAPIGGGFSGGTMPAPEPAQGEGMLKNKMFWWIGAGVALLFLLKKK